MASSPAYGERPPLQGIRRSFTVPHRQLSTHERAGLDKSDADKGLLYRHPSVRIISFAPPSESIVSKSSETHHDADYPIDTIETLPWRSRTEDLLASGAMTIEKVQGSVNFLKCGSNFVHSILRNSQCWCVDGEAKFVLRKGRLQYYRIELPNATEDDKAKVEELKSALVTVLKYEKTPCPFKRGFHVDLPEDAITPRRKGKWKRRDSSLLSPQDNVTPPLRRVKNPNRSTIGAPPTSFPTSFNTRRNSDFNTPPTLSDKPVQLERRRSIAERRAAFERPQNSRPQTPTSVISSGEVSQEEYEESESGSSIGIDSTSPSREPSPLRAQVQDSQQSELDVQHPDNQNVTNGAVQKESTQSPKELPSSPEETVESLPASESTEDVSEESSPLEADAEEPGVSETVVDQKTPDSLAEADETVSDLPVPLEQQDTSVDAEQIAEESVPRSPVEITEQPAAIAEQTEHDGNMVNVQPSEDVHAEEENPETAISVQAEAPLEDPVPEPSVPHLVATHDGEVVPEPELAADVEPQEDVSLDDTESIVSTTDSFHTVEADDDVPTLDNSQEAFLGGPLDPASAKRYQHKRELSELTVTASTYSSLPEPEVGEKEQPATPRLLKSSASDESWPDVQTPSANIQDGLRRRLKSHRSLSPLPPSPTIFVPPPPNHGNHLTAALLQKAATVAIVKPVEIVVLFVHILGRIAGGATLNDLLNGGLFQRTPQPVRRHQRNPSFPDHVVRHNDDDEDDDEEDDFGLPIRGRTRSNVSAAPSNSNSLVNKSDTTATTATTAPHRGSDADSMFDDDLD